jgi:hypothetical protein
MTVRPPFVTDDLRAHNVVLRAMLRRAQWGSKPNKPQCPVCAGTDIHFDECELAAALAVESCGGPHLCVISKPKTAYKSTVGPVQYEILCRIACIVKNGRKLEKWDELQRKNEPIVKISSHTSRLRQKGFLAWENTRLDTLYITSKGWKVMKKYKESIGVS